jgi:hypothetical protein
VTIHAPRREHAHERVHPGELQDRAGCARDVLHPVHAGGRLIEFCAVHRVPMGHGLGFCPTGYAAAFLQVVERLKLPQERAA